MRLFIWCVMINERIEKLRSLMEKNNMDAYIIVSDDYHSSEYVGDFFKAREYMSGFTGSAGILVVTKSEALLWTDGRYFLQAEEQLKNSEIKLMKMGEQGVPAIPEYLFDALDYNATVGFDGKTVTNSFVNSLNELLERKSISYSFQKDLVNDIWKKRPQISKEPVWELDTKYAGVGREKKLELVRNNMSDDADILILTALDEIAWLLNLRGNDVKCTPVFLAYMVVEKTTATLFVHNEILSEDIKNKLIRSGVSVAEYDSFYAFLSNIDIDKAVQMDFSTANYMASSSIGEGVCVYDRKSPVTLLKAIKNDVETENIRRAHLLDGIALCKFIYWLKGSDNITELDAVKRLKELRSINESYVEESFDAIVAYGPHGAIVHYEPTEQTNAEIERRSFCLVDTGGHYLEGSTDVTRTIAMGKLTDEEKKAFTVALKGHIALANAIFPHGVFGESIDAVAREPMWKYFMDYNHGTGHGVGYLLSVHEGPQSISWYGAKRKNHYPIEAGMIISNEPGYYKAGRFGIRHENLTLAKNIDNGFMCFETLTLAPFDLDGIDLSYLTENEISWLNAYHKRVYDTVSPYLDANEREWLKNATRSI